MDDLTGTDFGSYTITRLIRQASDRTIYAADHVSSGRTARLDVFAGRLEENSDAGRAFLKRASDAAQLVHPNAATVYDAGIIDTTPFIASQYDDAPDLEALRDELPKTPSPSLDILIQIAAAIDAAHQVGLIHSALRPDNIQVDANDHVLINGFGIQTIELPYAGDVPTDALWLSPEQDTGDGAEQATDIYQLGMLSYLLLSGRVPFESQFTDIAIDAHLREIPQPAHELNAALGPRTSLVIQSSLAKRPADRYATGAEFIDRLQQSIRNETVGGDPQLTSAAKNGPVSDETVELFPSQAQRRRQAVVGQQATQSWRQSASRIWFFAGGCLLALVVVLAAGIGAATAFSMIGSEERPTPTTPDNVVIYATFTATPTLEPRPTRTLPPPLPTATSTPSPTPTATPTGSNSSAQSTIPPVSTAPATTSSTDEASATATTPQPTPTAEPTATPTPSPTTVQAAEAPNDGEIQYNRPLNEWRNDEFSQGWIRPETSTLLIGVYGESSGQTMQAWTFINDWDDTSVSVDVRATTTGLEAAGCVALRHNLNQGEYRLCMFATGETNATYNSVSAGQSVELLEMEERSATRPPQSWNTLKIIAEGDDFWFYANGELLGHAEHGGRSTGSAAIQVTNWDSDDAEFEFRNLVVRDVD